MNWSRDALREAVRDEDSISALSHVPYVGFLREEVLYVRAKHWILLTVESCGDIRRGTDPTILMRKTLTNHYLPKEGEGK